MADAKTCMTCNHEFVPEEGYEYQDQCIVCWKKGKGYKLTKADTSHERLQEYWDEQGGELRRKLAAAERRASQAERKAERVQKKLNEERAKPDSAGRADLGGERISAARLKGLILLCHPDRHDNSKLSNELTKWLLDLRKTT